LIYKYDVIIELMSENNEKNLSSSFHYIFLECEKNIEIYLN